MKIRYRSYFSIGLAHIASSLRTQIGIAMIFGVLLTWGCSKNVVSPEVEEPTASEVEVIPEPEPPSEIGVSKEAVEVIQETDVDLQGFGFAEGSEVIEEIDEVGVAPTAPESEPIPKLTPTPETDFTQEPGISIEPEAEKMVEEILGAPPVMSMQDEVVEAPGAEQLQEARVLPDFKDEQPQKFSVGREPVQRMSIEPVEEVSEALPEMTAKTPLEMTKESFVIPEPEPVQEDHLLSSKIKAPPKLLMSSSPKEHFQKQKNILAETDRILSELKNAKIVFNHPEKMNIADDPVQIKLVLNTNKSFEELYESIEAPEKKEGKKIKTGSLMKAHLTGQGFQITAITDETQFISSNMDTKWKWQIKPIAHGRQTLRLTLTAHIKLKNISSTKPRTIRTFDKYILVEVTAFQKVQMFAYENWQWIWAAFLIPIATWYFSKKIKPS
jgi:hypothetical protein